MFNQSSIIIRHEVISKLILFINSLPTPNKPGNSLRSSGEHFTNLSVIQGSINTFDLTLTEKPIKQEIKHHGHCNLETIPFKTAIVNQA